MDPQMSSPGRFFLPLCFSGVDPDDMAVRRRLRRSMDGWQVGPSIAASVLTLALLKPCGEAKPRSRLAFAVRPSSAGWPSIVM